MLSDEYPFARLSVFYFSFLHHLVLAKLATCSIWVNIAYEVNFFDSTLILFDEIADSRYTFPETSSVNEFIEHYKSTLPIGCISKYVFGKN